MTFVVHTTFTPHPPQHPCTQIGARSNGAKNKPKYSALKPVYVIATPFDGPEGLHSAQPTLYKLGGVKMFRNSEFRLQNEVDVSVVDAAKNVFVKLLKTHDHNKQYWLGLRDLCEPLIVPAPTPRRSTRVITRARAKRKTPTPKRKTPTPRRKTPTPRRKRTTIKRSTPPPINEEVVSLQQELISTRKELTAARAAATAAQHAAQIVTAAVESLRNQISTPEPVTETPTRHTHRNKQKNTHRSPNKRSKPSPESAESPSSTNSDSPMPPRWFRKYNSRQRDLERMRRSLNPTLNVSPIMMNNMCPMMSPPVMSPPVMGFPMMSRFTFRNNQFW